MTAKILSNAAARRQARLTSALGLAALCALSFSWSAAGERDVIALAIAESGRGVFRIEASFLANSPCPAAWSVLTDYDGMESFVSSLKESNVKDRKKGRIYVEQVAQAKVLFFKKPAKVRLEVREHPKALISFKDVLGRDFSAYAGSWTLQKAPRGCLVSYRLYANPKTAAPDFLTKTAMKRTARQLLGEVRREIARRAGK